MTDVRMLSDRLVVRFVVNEPAVQDETDLSIAKIPSNMVYRLTIPAQCDQWRRYDILQVSIIGSGRDVCAQELSPRPGTKRLPTVVNTLVG